MDALDWKEIKEAKPQAVRETLAWVQGYILALEDVIKDLEIQWHGYLNDPDARRALGMIQKKIEDSLLSAQRTLEAINKIIEEDT
jgi:hypothetical protein